MGDAIVRNLADKTGKSLDEWFEVVAPTGLTEKKAIAKFLKEERGLGHFQAQKVAERFVGEDAYRHPETFASDLFSEPGEYQLFEQLRDQLLAVGDDVRLQPCRTYQPFYRKTQFALLTKRGDDIVLGLALPGVAINAPLENDQRLGSERITASVKVNHGELNGAVREWVKKAYELNG